MPPKKHHIHSVTNSQLQTFEQVSQQLWAKSLSMPMKSCSVTRPQCLFMDVSTVPPWDSSSKSRSCRTSINICGAPRGNCCPCQDKSCWQNRTEGTPHRCGKETSQEKSFNACIDLQDHTIQLTSLREKDVKTVDLETPKQLRGNLVVRFKLPKLT